MRYVIGGLVVLYMVVMFVGMVTGRIRVKSCCAISDPSKDARMRLE
jgi:hypothetical protein